MDRLWAATLLLGGLLAAVAWWNGLLLSAAVQAPYDTVLIGAALLVLLFAVLAFLGRGMAYVQARSDHIRVATPFLRLKISYRRVRIVHPADFHQLFPPDKASWAQRQFLEPFYGKTALVVELNSLPMSPAALRLFLPAQMLDPKVTGMVFLVKDWMKLSTEIDSLMAAWRQAQNRPSAPSRPAAPGLLGTLKKR